MLSMDGPTCVLIGLKALTCLASLLAAGSALCLAGLTTLDGETARALRRLGLASSLAAAAAGVALIPANAVFLAGGSWPTAADPVLNRLVGTGPVGESLLVRLAGLVLVAALFGSRRVPRGAGVAGAVIICASFAFRGHVVLAEARFVLAILLTAHLAGVAFWLGAFFPLHRLARGADPTRAGAAAEEFGRKAQWVVAGLAGAGAALLVALTGNPLDVIGSPYGQLFAIKLIVFGLLLGLAAFNRLRLTPALRSGSRVAGRRLRRTIEAEAAAASAILVTTAALTTLASPEMPA